MNATAIERFMAKVSPEPNTGCWLWTGAILHYGYGRIWSGEKVLSAHRFAWEAWRGPVPGGLCVLHKCDVPGCVNPDHLWLGTNAENTRDMIRKGRVAAGPRHGSATMPDSRPKGECVATSKLTEADVVAIRADKRSARTVGADYGVSDSLVYMVRKRVIWRHVPEGAS